MILERDKYQCKFCGNYAEQVTFIVPLACGGKMEADNAVLLCDDCRMNTENRGYIFVNIPINEKIDKILHQFSIRTGRSESDILRQLISEYVLVPFLAVRKFNGCDKRIKLKINKRIYEEFDRKIGDFCVKDVIGSLVENYLFRIENLLKGEKYEK